jgi:hypothetical protein
LSARSAVIGVFASLVLAGCAGAPSNRVPDPASPATPAGAAIPHGSLLTVAASGADGPTLVVRDTETGRRVRSLSVPDGVDVSTLTRRSFSGDWSRLVYVTGCEVRLATRTPTGYRDHQTYVAPTATSGPGAGKPRCFRTAVLSARGRLVALADEPGNSGAGADERPGTVYTAEAGDESGALRVAGSQVTAIDGDGRPARSTAVRLAGAARSGGTVASGGTLLLASTAPVSGRITIQRPGSTAYYRCSDRIDATRLLCTASLGGAPYGAAAALSVVATGSTPTVTLTPLTTVRPGRVGPGRPAGPGDPGNSIANAVVNPLGATALIQATTGWYRVDLTIRGAPEYLYAALPDQEPGGEHPICLT